MRPCLAGCPGKSTRTLNIFKLVKTLQLLGARLTFGDGMLCASIPVRELRISSGYLNDMWPPPQISGSPTPTELRHAFSDQVDTGGE
jgi:hypothetical protein